METNNLILLTGNDNFFGQTRKPWVSLNVEKLQNYIEQQGYQVTKYSFHELINRKERLKDSIIFYTFSQKNNRREYIKDLVHCLNNGSNFLIPSYDLLLCHENKGYQELYKQKINLTMLPSFYFSSVKEISSYQFKFPIVLKTTDGSNGKGVFLARTKEELIQIIRKLERQSFLTKIDLIRRRYFRRKKSYKEYPDYNNVTDYYQYKDYILKEKNFILQEFVPNLQFDYRVLVIYDKYYVIKRRNRENDFRASGAKRFDSSYQATPDLLHFARSVYQNFDTPFLSMDICQYENQYYLFEFQALHFGINVFVKTNGYYQLIHNNWEHVEAHPDFEREMAQGLVKYLNARFKKKES